MVATTRENISPSLVLELLKRIGGIIKVRVSNILVGSNTAAGDCMAAAVVLSDAGWACRTIVGC